MSTGQRRLTPMTPSTWRCSATLDGRLEQARLVDRLLRGVELGLVDRREQRLAAREAALDGAAIDAGALGDRRHAGAGLRRRRGGAGREDGIEVAGGVGAH
jgi:hypothetical protein